MRIMYFAFEGFDTKNGTNHLALKMVDEFLKAGIEVYFVSSHSTGLADDIPDILKGRKGFTYDIINRSIVSKKNFLQRYWDGFTYAFKAKRAWGKKISDIDAVILQSTPTAVFSSILLKLFGKKPIIYNSYDIFPDGPYAIGAITNKIVYKVLQMLEKIVYATSTKIAVISSDMKAQLQRLGVPKHKIVEIKAWYDDESVETIPFSNNKFAKKYKLSEEVFYVQYAGNIGYTFDYQFMLEVADILKDENEIVFQVVGEGAFKGDFITEAEEIGLTNIKFYPWQPIEIISDVYSLCSIQLIPLAKGVIWNSFPSKGSLLMACERVILCATERGSNYYKEINQNQVGICVPNTSPQDAANEIMDLFYNRRKLKEIGEKAKKYSKSKYSSTVNVNKFIKLLEEVVNG